MKIFKIADVALKLSQFMAEEIAIDFENYEEHYEDPNDPNVQAEKVLYEKLQSGNYNFTNEELLMIGQTLSDISTKDLFAEVPANRRELFSVELQLGMWKPISDEEARQVVRNGMGVKMSHFPKFNGQRYDYNDSWGSQFGG